MMRRRRQSGVTLLEVLVGFVIFTSSLVAVLDYVSGQVYQVHRTSSNLDRLERIYESSITLGEADVDHFQSLLADGRYQVEVDSVNVDAGGRHGQERYLRHYRYRVEENGRLVEWTVIRLE